MGINIIYNDEKNLDAKLVTISHKSKREACVDAEEGAVTCALSLDNNIKFLY